MLEKINVRLSDHTSEEVTVDDDFFDRHTRAFAASFLLGEIEKRRGPCSQPVSIVSIDYFEELGDACEVPLLPAAFDLGRMLH